MSENPAGSYNAVVRFIDENLEKGLGNKVAIHCENEQVTYLELKNRVDKFAAALANIDIEYENRVLLLMHDTPEFFYSFFGSIKIGAVPVPVNTLLSVNDYEYLLNNSRAKAIVVSDDLWEKIKSSRSKFTYLKHVIVLSEQPNQSEDVIHYNDFIDNNFEIPEIFQSTENDQAFWLYSSGSTGRPKGAMHLQKSMEYAYDNYAKKVLRITEDDITLSASKLFFAYGMGNGMYFPLGAGGSSVLIKNKPTPEKVFEAIEKYKPTIFFGVPTLYGAMLDYVENSDNKYDLSSIRVCVSAGEQLPQTFIRKWKEKFNLNILDGIGSTEALHIYLSNTTERIMPGSTGKVVPGYEAKIVNEEFEEVAAHEIGDLMIKGESIASAYWRKPNENKRKYHGEWMYTGDKYYQDEEGYFWYCGRSDDMLNVGGILVSPVEIESVIIDNDDVLEVAVIGNENQDGLVKAIAYVVLKEGIIGDSNKETELKNYVKSKLAKYKYPREIIFLDELPKTATGKIQRFKLRNAVKSKVNL